MHSSTSSFERYRECRWGLVGVLSVVVAIACVAAFEMYWRGLGYGAGIIDSPQLWALERDKAIGNDGKTLVLLGASRTQYGFDMNVLASALPAYRPVMLAVNGRYPLAALRSLAADKRFAGVVLCDVNARGLSRSNHPAQQEYVDYYDTQWTPAWRLHRILLNSWQRLMAVSRPELGLPGGVRTWLGGGAMPWRPNFRLYRDRSGDLDLARGDASGLADYFAGELARSIESNPPSAPDIWLRDLQPVADWVAAIRRRGGEVIFFESPVSGRQRQLEEQAYPRERYWDRFVALVGGPSLNYADVPALATMRLPDESHVDLGDKAGFTLAVVDALRSRGLLK